jgi:hypothetical protein
MGSSRFASGKEEEGQPVERAGSARGLLCLFCPLTSSTGLGNLGLTTPYQPDSLLHLGSILRLGVFLWLFSEGPPMPHCLSVPTWCLFNSVCCSQQDNTGATSWRILWLPDLMTLFLPKTFYEQLINLITSLLWNPVQGGRQEKSLVP